MLEKVGFGPKQGKTKRAIEQVAEHLLKGDFVVYVTNELSYQEVQRLVWDEAPDAMLVNLIVEIGTPVQEVLTKYSEEVVIVLDGVIRENEVGSINCENPFYIYYKKMANVKSKVV